MVRGSDPRKNLSQTSRRKIRVSELMEEKLRKNVLGNCYSYNGKDSEMIFLASLVKSLSRFLGILCRDYADQGSTVEINNVILGISSYYYPCEYCRGGVQGFLYNLEHLITNMAQCYDLPLIVGPDCSNLAFLYGRETLQKGAFTEENLSQVKVDSREQWIKPGKHQVIWYIPEENIGRTF
jgi:hypothetical protein